jgi:hypothetical protein
LAGDGANRRSKQTVVLDFETRFPSPATAPAEGLATRASRLPRPEDSLARMGQLPHTPRRGGRRFSVGRGSSCWGRSTDARPGGVLVHCTIGRDHAGLVTLLLLPLASVAPADIADDWELSNPRLEPLRAGSSAPAEALARRNLTAARSSQPRSRRSTWRPRSGPVGSAIAGCEPFGSGCWSLPVLGPGVVLEPQGAVLVDGQGMGSLSSPRKRPWPSAWRQANSHLVPWWCRTRPA